MLTLRIALAAVVVLTLACAAPTSPVLAGPATQGSVGLRLAAWNVANLFDSVDGPFRDPVLEPSRYEAKLQEVADVLDTVQADFVGLAEVENIACLRDLNQALARPYPQYGLLEGNDTDRGIDVAFLSRVPVTRVVSHRHHDLPDAPGVSKSYRFSRDCLEVVLDTEPPVTLLINHFKSQLGDKKQAAAKRRVQAQGVVEIVREIASQRPDGLEVVLGDLNDRPESWSLEPLKEEFVDVFSGWPVRLRATHRSRGGATPLDYILVSQDGLARLADARVWQGLGEKTSDHDPISVMLSVDRAPGQAESRGWTESGP
jgi:endonuclease/exonuclease/phosphatase family metal-dependent hydrolase